MKTNTMRRYEYSADLYTFTTSQDAQGGDVLTFNLNRTIKVHAVSGVAGKLMIYLKREDSDATSQCRLGRFLDATGTEIRPGGVWTLQETEPTFDMWGAPTGFRGRAVYIGTEG